ncbi:MAG: hypothetical protein ACYCPS_02500 [Candidatus Saccharimonadales bacterium]
MDPFFNLYNTKPIHQTTLVFKGNEYLINYMPEGLMKEAHVTGFVRNGQVYISEALGGQVKRFVTCHELYHLIDKQTWLGYFGMELRANFMCGLKDPLGFLATIRNGLGYSKFRIYLKRMLKNNSTLTK